MFFTLSNFSVIELCRYFNRKKKLLVVLGENLSSFVVSAVSRQVALQDSHTLFRLFIEGFSSLLKVFHSF
jgi:hypothetical protein